jgi:ABC-type nitrate/sulfonate/bicarbonate transport system substrate-binding protein
MRSTGMCQKRRWEAQFDYLIGTELGLTIATPERIKCIATTVRNWDVGVGTHPKNRIREGETMFGPTKPPSRAAGLFLIAAAAAFNGCALTASMAEAAPGATLPVTAIELEPIPNPAIAYDRMAIAMGLPAKHGLDLKLGPDLAGGGPERVQAVVTKNTDVAVGDVIAALGAIYSGAKIKVLMVMTPYGDEEVWGQNKYQTMKDAEGQAWGVASLGGAQRFNAQLAVQGLGLKPDAFRWVALGGGDGPSLQALDTGRTQLGSLSHLGAVQAEAKGFTKTIHALIPHTAKYTPPVPRLVVVARAEWITDHQAEATAYVEMMLDMMRQWQDNADTWVKPGEAIFKNSGMTAEQLEQGWRAFRDGGYFSVNGGVNLAATQKLMDLFFKIRNESPNQDLAKPADLYDTGPLKAALDKMGVVKGTPGRPDTPDWYKGAAASKG